MNTDIRIFVDKKQGYLCNPFGIFTTYQNKTVWITGTNNINWISNI